MRLPTTCGHARYDACADRWLELAAREIVKKKQGLSTLHNEIIDRHRNQVDADRVVPPGLDCDLYFCADAVDRSDQNRVAKAGLFEVEQSAKPADLRVSTRS